MDKGSKMNETKIASAPSVITGRFRSRRTRSLAAQKGLTIIEVMIALVVAIAIWAMATGRMSMLFGRSDVTTEQGNMTTLMSNARELKTISGYGATGTNLVPTMISRGYVPDNMSVVGGIIYNVWGGAVEISSLGIKYSVKFNAVPKEACNALATKSNTGTQFSSLQVNSAAAVIGEYTSAKAATDCSADLTNTLTWTSRN